MSSTPTHSMSLSRSLRGALVSGLVVGALFGVIDAIVAWRIGTADLEVLSFLGCVAAAVFQYALVWVAIAVVGTIALRPWVARRGPDAHALFPWRLTLFVGAFLEIYWWTRPFVFYGWPSLGFARLSATAGLALVALGVAWVLAPVFQRVVEPRARLASILVVLVALCGAGYLKVAGGSIGSEGETNAKTREMPNVLLVVVDALRQDTLGCYGHPRVKSPHVDRLAREGVVFENAFTQAPFTWTSFGSMLTGKYPRRHGLVLMEPGKRMPPNVTLASHLQRACFDAGSTRHDECLVDPDVLGITFHTGTLSTGSGLLRGFDLYYEQMAGHGIVMADSAWSVFRSDLLLHLFGAKLEQKAGGDVGGTARGWLDQFGGRRFLAMVHLYSTHTPYDPTASSRALYVDPAYKGRFQSFYARDREAIESGEHVPDEADVAQIRNLYYAGVTDADTKIGAILQSLERQGVLDDTLVIVTADHGESLGESNLWEHNHMVQTNLRIPLVMRWPKGLPAGTRVKALVDEIDVFPTVCDLMDLDLPAEPPPLGTIDGTSLVPLVRGQVTSVREYSFAENPVWSSIQDSRWKLVVPTALLPASEWPKQVTEYGEHPWLVEVGGDLEDARDVFAEHPAEVNRLLAALRAYDASMPIRAAEEVRSARDIEAQRRAIAAFGYADGVKGHGPKKAHTPGDSNAPTPDPKKP